MPALALFTFSFSMVVKHKVFKSKILFYTNVLNEGTFCIITFVFFIYYLFGGKMSNNARFNFFGWGLIILISLTVLINVVLGTIGGYLMIKELCCKKKSEKQVADKRTLKKRVTEEDG